MKCLFGTLMLCSLATLAHCEIYVTERAKGKSIPDPESVLAVASLLSNKTVVESLNLDIQTRVAVSQLMKDCKGSLTLYSASAEIPASEFIQQANDYRSRNEARLHELLDPSQLDRLKQIAYQIEIRRVGLGTALNSGCLGKRLGVEEYQHEPISKLTELADNQFIVEINSNKRLIWRRLVEILDENQKVTLDKCVGKLFLFRDQPHMTTDADGFVIPDPEDTISIVSLLRNRSVADELSLSVDASDELIKVARTQSSSRSEAMRNLDGTDARMLKFRIATEESKRELLKHVSDETLARLRQIAFQVEIERMGIKRAMLAGRLASYLELSTKQREEVEATGGEVEKEFEEAVAKARMNHTSTILSGLHPVQLSEVKSVLGETINFRESSIYPMMSNK